MCLFIKLDLEPSVRALDALSFLILLQSYMHANERLIVAVHWKCPKHSVKHGTDSS